MLHYESPNGWSLDLHEADYEGSGPRLIKARLVGLEVMTAVELAADHLTQPTDEEVARFAAPEAQSAGVSGNNVIHLLDASSISEAGALGYIISLASAQSSYKVRGFLLETFTSLAAEPASRCLSASGKRGEHGDVIRMAYPADEVDLGAESLSELEERLEEIGTGIHVETTDLLEQAANADRVALLQAATPNHFKAPLLRARFDDLPQA